MAKRGVFRRVVRRIRSEARDARLLGSGIFKRQAYRFTGQRECVLRLAGVGPIRVRLDDTDLPSFLGIFGELEYEFPIPEVEAAARARYEAILAAGRVPVVVDAGAYVGASALWFRSKFPLAQIVAIEPDADSFRLLEQNVAASEGVRCLHAAVGSTPGRARLVPSAGSWAMQVERSNRGIDVITMNEAFAVENGEPLLAKINIEGFEEDVFSSNLEWLDQLTLLYLEPHDWLFPGKHTSRSFQKALGDRDFHLFIVGPHLCYARL